MSDNLLRSPRPVPVFNPTNSFKRKTSGPHYTPPCPPVKSSAPVSRVFRNRERSASVPVAVSFRQRRDSSPINSPHYNAKVLDLYYNQCFHVLGNLGSGSFGEVFKVQSKEDGQFYAVKRSRQRFRGAADRKWKLEEVNRHENIPPHDNCIKFYKAWEEGLQLYIQTELCEMSLKDYSDQIDAIPEQAIWNILVDLCSGLKHIHGSGITHMDIKPANLFLGRDGCYKIGDFGLAIDLLKESCNAQEGDPKYLAPELMQSQYSSAVDIFSLGISLLELACNIDLPRSGALWHQLRRGDIPTDITKDISDDLVSVISSMMNPVVAKRPTASDVLLLRRVQQVLRRRQYTGALCYVNRLLWGVLSPLCSVYRMPFNYIWSWFDRKSVTAPVEGQSRLIDDFEEDDDISVLLDHSTKHNPPSSLSMCSPMKPGHLHVRDASFQQSILRDSGFCSDHLASADTTSCFDGSLHTPTKLNSSFSPPDALRSSSPILAGKAPPGIRLFDQKYCFSDDNVSLKSTVEPRNLLGSFQ